jgi:hypothetical protein
MEELLLMFIALGKKFQGVDLKYRSDGAAWGKMEGE